MSYEKDSMLISLASKGYIGYSAEEITRNWYNSIPKAIVNCYPSDMWEASFIYTETHSIDSIIAIGKGELQFGEEPVGPQPDERVEWLKDYFSKTSYTRHEIQIVLEYVLRVKLEHIQADGALQALCDYFKDNPDEIKIGVNDFYEIYSDLRSGYCTNDYDDIILKIREVK